MDYGSYKGDFFRKVAALTFPADCVRGTPNFFVSVPNTWHLKWEHRFADHFYVSLRELWSHKMGRPAKRRLFTFHYGPIIALDAGGKINWHHGDPVVLRIDQKDGVNPHLHYQNPTPHYEQNRVQDLTIVDADMFAFLNAVFRSRQEHRDISEVLGFKLT